jgi:hypothetical protein
MSMIRIWKLDASLFVLETLRHHIQEFCYWLVGMHADK